MQLIKLAYFTLIFLQMKLNTFGIVLGHVNVLKKNSNEELEVTHNLNRDDMRFIQNILDKMYARATSIPQDEAIRMLKLMMKKMLKSTTPMQDEYWLLRQG